MENNLTSPQWLDYVVYVDSIVSEALLRTIGCRSVLVTPVTLEVTPNRFACQPCLQVMLQQQVKYAHQSLSI